MEAKFQRRNGRMSCMNSETHIGRVIKWKLILRLMRQSITKEGNRRQ